MDVERRLLLYVVVLGCAVGVGAVALRRAAALHAHAMSLVALAAVAVAGLLREEIGRAVAWPAFGVWAAIAVAPTMLVSAARRAAWYRRFSGAAAFLRVAEALLFRPVTLRREASLYAALDAAESGDEHLCRARLDDLVALETVAGTDARSLADAVAAAAARRWDDVVRAVDSCRNRTSIVLAAEAHASAETGDLRRAFRAERELSVLLRGGAPALAHVRRCVLAACGRAPFLAEARAQQLAVADGPPGALDLAVARALEAAGDADGAVAAYRAVASSARGLHRRDADEGAERCARGGMRVAHPDELEVAALLDLEHACRTERRDLSRRPALERSPATLAICAATAVASLGAFVLLGTDVLSLVAAGAVSAPLVVDEGAWWRVVTAMLLHGGVVHLMLNLASILVVGIPFEERAGPARTIVVYLGSGVLASLASVHFNRTDVGVGASGAAMGLFGALAAMLFLRRDLFDPSERKRWLVAAAIVLVANGAIGALEHEAVDNAAHAGGMVAGLVLGALVLLRGRVRDADATGDPPANRPAAASRLDPVWRAAAAALVGVVLLAVGAALRDAGTWRGSRDVRMSGAHASLPAWLRRTAAPRVGTIALRLPVPFAVQLGDEATSAPDPDGVLLALGGEEKDLGTWDDAERQPSPRLGPGGPLFDGMVETRVWRASKGDDVRGHVLRRGGAFAVVVALDGPEGGPAFEPFVLEVARTLGTVPPADESGRPGDGGR